MALFFQPLDPNLLKPYGLDQYTVKTVKNKNISKTFYDLNQDSKVDQIDTYKNKKRIKRVMDRNSDGQFDQTNEVFYIKIQVFLNEPPRIITLMIK